MVPSRSKNLRRRETRKGIEATFRALESDLERPKNEPGSIRCNILFLALKHVCPEGGRLDRVCHRSVNIPFVFVFFVFSLLYKSLGKLDTRCKANKPELIYRRLPVSAHSTKRAHLCLSFSHKSPFDQHDSRPVLSHLMQLQAKSRYRMQSVGGKPNSLPRPTNELLQS